MASWTTTGNAAAAGDFLGTKNNQPLVIKTDTVERLRVDINGNVGIGTPNPGYPLHIAAGKQFRMEGGTNAADAENYFSFGGNGTFGIDAPGAPNGRLVVQNNGNVGIGTSAPVSTLQVNGGVTVTGSYGPNRVNNQGDYYVEIGTGFPNDLMNLSLAAPGELGPVLSLMNTSGGVNAAAALDFYTFDPGEGDPNHETSPSSEIKALDVGNFGNDIVFLSNQPGAPNNALVERMRITSTGNINVPGDIILTGADCAEQFDIREGDELEPGTVVVIDETGVLRKSCDEYDRKVAGVVSGAGEFKHAILLDQRQEVKGRAPVALVGKVYCKVDARFSPIRVGDLLTTSSTPGHAMKAANTEKSFGAVLGKALRSLAEGTGLVPILVALQ